MKTPAHPQKISVVTHPLIDILVPCNEGLLSQLSLSRGTHEILDRHEQEKLLHACEHLAHTIVSGGAGSNLAACARLLGVQASVLGLAANDPYGFRCVNELESLGISCPVPRSLLGITGSCLSLITPDSERTMRTHLGVAGELSDAHLDIPALTHSSYVVIEGYFLAGSANNRAALFKTVEACLAAGTPLAFTCSSPQIALRHREEIQREIAPHVAILFANELEALALSGMPRVADAFTALRSRLSNVIVTASDRGAYVSYGEESFHQPAFPIGDRAVDSTGAGDAFAGTLLAALLSGVPVRAASRGAARVAAEVVTQLNSRAPSSAQALFTESSR